MTDTMFKAWLAGFGIIVIAYAAWFAFLWAGTFSEFLVLLLWASPFIAALVSSYIGPAKKILLGASMAVPSAILALVFNTVSQMLGNAVDFPGFRGAVILFTATFICAGIVSLIGGIVGYFLARSTQEK